MREIEKIIKIVKYKAKELRDNAAYGGEPHDRGASELEEILDAYLCGRANQLPKRIQDVLDEHDKIANEEYKEYIRLRDKYGGLK